MNKVKTKSVKVTCCWSSHLGALSPRIRFISSWICFRNCKTVNKYWCFKAKYNIIIVKNKDSKSYLWLKQLWRGSWSHILFINGISCIILGLVNNTSLSSTQIGVCAAAASTVQLAEFQVPDVSHCALRSKNLWSAAKHL